MGLSFLYANELKIDSLQCILQQYNDDDTSEMHIQTIIDLGDCFYDKYDFPAVVENFRRALKLAEKGNHEKFIIYCRLIIGETCYRQDRKAIGRN